MACSRRHFPLGRKVLARAPETATHMIQYEKVFIIIESIDFD